MIDWFSFIVVGNAGVVFSVNWYAICQIALQFSLKPKTPSPIYGAMASIPRDSTQIQPTIV
jgi:hypothetical protein